MKLHFHPISHHCRRVIALSKHLGQELELKLVDLNPSSADYAALSKVNPNGKVPVLEDGAVVLTEGNAIMGYLAGKQDTPLWPKSNTRYDIMRWFNWEAAHLQAEAVSPVAMQRLAVPMRGGTPDEKIIKEGEEVFARFAGVLDNHLAGKKWLVDDELTLADFAVGSTVDFATIAGLPVASYGNVARWQKALGAIPAWRDTAPKME